jgi:prepilin-type N-terminal cleavage/methylation domain-containing protein
MGGRLCRITPHGFTLIELLLSTSITVVLLGIALPVGGDALDDMRARAAARYLSGRIATNRLAAINGSRSIGIRFTPAAPDYEFAAYVDGNDNGIRTADILSGIDVATGGSRQLASEFRGIHFGLAIGISDLDGVRNSTSDGVRIGTARILTLSPDGTATSGTLYVQGGHAQYAIRVLGATGRTRVLKYDTGSRSWVSP